MDQVPLVDEKKDDGKKFVEYLTHAGFEVTAAFWLKPIEAGQWYLYIASPVVDSEGLYDAYGRLQTAFRQMSPPLWIDPFEVRLIGTAHPIAKDVLNVLGRHARGPMAINYGGAVLGGLSIEGAHLYPLPAAVAGP